MIWMALLAAKDRSAVSPGIGVPPVSGTNQMNASTAISDSLSLKHERKVGGTVTTGAGGPLTGHIAAARAVVSSGATDDGVGAFGAGLAPHPDHRALSKTKCMHLK